MMIDFSALNGHEDMLMPGTAEIAQMRADAIPLLTQLNERENLHTQKVIPLKAGMWNALYRLEPGGVVAKLSAGENDFEINFLREATTLQIAVPQVFSSGRLEHPTLPVVTYFLMTYVPNCVNAWSAAHTEQAISPNALQQLGADLGYALAKLHTVPLGYVARFGMRVESWQQVLMDGFSPDWDNIAQNTLFDDELLTIFERILDKTGYFAFTDGTLTHNDLNLSNVLVDVNTHQLRAILDPAGYAGMPMFDLGYAAMPWDHGFGFYHAILDSYRQHSTQFDTALFYTSLLVVAYRHERFHTPAVRESVFRDILPHLDV